LAFSQVIKVGTSSLINAECKTFNLTALAALAETVSDLREAGHGVVVVASGAVGAGCQRVGLSKRPAGLARRRALAAVGQMHLMRYFSDFFSSAGLVSCLLQSYSHLLVHIDRSLSLSTFMIVNS